MSFFIKGALTDGPARSGRVAALFLILIAAMNYMNLATARSASRAREVSLRKVFGSRRGPLIGQFLTASLMSITITFVTISFKAWQAAVTNPANAVRTE